MPRTLEFFFDLMSPYSYLASTRVEEVAKRAGATLVWKPCYLPGIMRAIDHHGPTSNAVKAMYTLKDLNDWAVFLKLPPIVLPDPFPFQSAAADRIALCVESEVLPKFVARMFQRIWADGVNCNDPAVLSGALTDVGLTPAAIIEKSQGDDARAKLKANTEEAVARGAFGVPTFFIGDDMYVGNDRLDFVERALLK